MQESPDQQLLHLLHRQSRYLDLIEERHRDEAMSTDKH